MGAGACVRRRRSKRRELALWLLNSAVLPHSGIYALRRISLDTARELSAHRETRSAVGHPSTAAWLSKALGLPVPVNRINASLRRGQQALVVRMRRRLPEGVTLDIASLSTLRIELFLLERID